MNLGVTDVTRWGLLCSWFKPEVRKLWPNLAPRLFLNKVLLEHGPSCFHATTELSGFHRDQVATKPKTFTISSFSGAWRPALHLEASGKARRELGGTREGVGAVCRALSVDSAPFPTLSPDAARQGSGERLSRAQTLETLHLCLKETKAGLRVGGGAAPHVDACTVQRVRGFLFSSTCLAGCRPRPSQALRVDRHIRQRGARHRDPPAGAAADDLD